METGVQRKVVKIRVFAKIQINIFMNISLLVLGHMDVGGTSTNSAVVIQCLTKVLLPFLA